MSEFETDRIPGVKIALPWSMCFLMGLGLFLPAVTPAQTKTKPIIGPMPGFSTPRTVMLWLQGRQQGNVTVRYWPRSDPKQSHAVETTLVKANQWVGHLHITGLTPGTSYAYQVNFQDKKINFGQPLYFKTQPQWQWRSEPPPFKVTLGSCAFINDAPFDRPGSPWGGDYSIFQAIVEQKPDFMLWLGDNLYFRETDYDDPASMAQRYTQTRRFPALQTLLRSTHHYAVWDDHDFGPNNANGSFGFKQESLTLFRRFWANPQYGSPRVPGIFGRFDYHDVAFFLLDNRFYRDSDKAPADADKAMFGKRQLDWLKNALLQSKATFKVIANGTQLFNDDNGFEGWNHFPQERQAFLDWLKETDIAGLLFLSGDRHHTELLSVPRPGTYPLVELTCSPLTAGTHPLLTDHFKKHLVDGTLVGQRNFCQLAFHGKRENRQVDISAYDVKGRKLWEKSYAVSDLGGD